MGICFWNYPFWSAQQVMAFKLNNNLIFFVVYLDSEYENDIIL